MYLFFCYCNLNMARCIIIFDNAENDEKDTVVVLFCKKDG